MRFGLISVLSVLALQSPVIPSAAIGVWDDGVRMQLPSRDPQAPRLIATGGDSLVTETGPYDSVARPGLKVTTRTISRFRGDSLFGSFEARYSDGSVTRGKTTGSRRKQVPGGRGSIVMGKHREEIGKAGS